MVYVSSWIMIQELLYRYFQKRARQQNRFQHALRLHLTQLSNFQLARALDSMPLTHEPSNMLVHFALLQGSGNYFKSNSNVTNVINCFFFSLLPLTSHLFSGDYRGSCHVARSDTIAGNCPAGLLHAKWTLWFGNYGDRATWLWVLTVAINQCPCLLLTVLSILSMLYSFRINGPQLECITATVLLGNFEEPSMLSTVPESCSPIRFLQ